MNVKHALEATTQNMVAQKNVMCAEVDFIIIKLPRPYAQNVLVAVIYQVQQERVAQSVH